MVEQGLEARLDVGDAGGVGLLADLDEFLDQLRVLRKVSAVDDQRIAVGVQPNIFPIDVAEISSELVTRIAGPSKAFAPLDLKTEPEIARLIHVATSSS